MRSPLLQRAVDHAHQHHDADVVVEPESMIIARSGAVGLATRRRHAADHGLEDVVDAFARLGRAGDGVGGVDADHVLDLRAWRARGSAWGRSILLSTGTTSTPSSMRGVAVGHRLRLDTLARIDHEQRAFAGRQRAADLIREVDVSGRVDEVEVVDCWPSRAVYCKAAVCALMVMPRSRSMSIESSTCASISRSLKPPQRWMRRSASVDLP